MRKLCNLSLLNLFVKHLVSRTLSFFLFTFFLAANIAIASTSPGISYTGRIMKADGVTPVVSSGVTFSIGIYDVNKSCLMFTETRTLDLSASGGTFAFDIGDGTGAASYKGNVTDVFDIFNNAKTFSSLTCGIGTGFTALTANEPRTLMVSFDAGDGNGAQTLPALKINPVPMAGQAYNTQKIAGYGTGDLLRVNSGVDKTANANTDLTQTQYDEFWRLVKNPSTAYLTAATSGALAGDVTGTIGANTVTKLQGYAVAATAPTTTYVLTWNGSAWAPAAATGSGGLSTILTSANFYLGNASNGAVARTMSGDATMDNAGVVTLATTGVTAGTYTKITVDAKGRATVGAALASSDVTTALGFTPSSATSSLATALTSANFYLGNASNIAMPVIMSGDASMINTGAVTVVKTTTGTASTILSLDGSGVANVKGVSLQTGTGSLALQSAGTTTNYSLTFPAAAPGSNGQILSVSTAGVMSWVTPGTGTPAGSDSYVQYNSSGAFGADSGFTYTTGALNVAGNAAVAISASTSTGTGVRGTSGSGSGVYGVSTSGPGVSGSSSSNAGLFGSSSSNAGVMGMSNSGAAIYGSSSSGNGGYFTSSTGYALVTGTGNVGIGTPTPSQLLNVEKNQNGSTQILVKNGSSGANSEAQVYFTNDIGLAGSVGSASSNYLYGYGNRMNVWANTTALGIALTTENTSGNILFATGGPPQTNERMRISSNGFVGIGTKAPEGVFHTASDGYNDMTIESYGSNDYDHSYLNFRRGRGSQAAKAATQSGDPIMSLDSWPYDGTAYDNAWTAASTSIQAYAEENATSGSKAASLRFFTRAPAASANSERLRITQTGYVGIGTISPGALLEVAGQVKITGGTPGAGKVLTSDAAGLASWQAAGGGWGLTGNSGTTAGTNFIGTTDDNNFVVKRFNVQSGLLDTSRDNNSWGVGALNSSATGTYNTAIGNGALKSLTSGVQNVAVGFNSQTSNTTANDNTSVGMNSLYFNSSGYDNTAIGRSAMISNTSGAENVAVGKTALNTNNGSKNVGIGIGALFNATSASRNIAIGYYSGTAITTGANNVVLGANDGTAIATSSNNILISDGSGNLRMFIDPSGNVGIGTASAPTHKLEVVGSSGATVGYFSDGAQSCSITPATAGSITCSSDERLKKNIEPFADTAALENILKLQTVTYEWRSVANGRHTGYIAQEIEKVAPEFVVTSKDGFKQVSYTGFIPWITSSIKVLYGKIVGHDLQLADQARQIASQQSETDVLKVENAKLKQENEAIKARLEKIESALHSK